MRHKLLAAAAIVAAGVMSSGCAYYEYGTEGRTVKVYKFGMKTEIGELEAATPQGSLRIKGMTSDGTSVTEKLVDRIPIPMGFGGGGTHTTTVVPVPTPAPAVVVPAPAPAPAPAPSLPDPGDPTLPVQPVSTAKPRTATAAVAKAAAKPTTRPAAPVVTVAQPAAKSAGKSGGKPTTKPTTKSAPKPAAKPEPAPVLVRVTTTQPTRR